MAYDGLRRNPGLVVGLVLVLVLALMALLAPVIAPADPTGGDLAQRLRPPDAEHWLGTDHQGRDVLSRVIWGARYSLGVAAATAAVSLGVGLLAGMAAGYLGCWVDEVLMRLVDLIKPFPGRILAMVLVGVLGPGLWNLGLAMAAVSWVGMARVVRGIALSLKEREYVLAARAHGVRPWTIIRRHILPGVLPQVAVLAALEVSWFITGLSGFSLLGLGAQPSTPEWGMMVSEARQYFRTHPVLLFAPCAAIMLAVLGFTLIGEGVRDLMDPQQREGGGRHGREPEAGSPLLAVEDLSVAVHTPSGPVPVVSGVSFRIAPGEVVALVGESGAGKSMTARALLGVLPPGARVTGGAVRLRGRDLLACSEREWERVRGREIGMVLQEALGALNPVLTVGRQITEVLERHEGLRGAAAAARAEELLRQVGLPDARALLRTYPHQLSGGMRQRVLIAQAIAARPRLLVADEPTTALDVRLRAEIRALLAELGRRQGMAMLLITHDLSAVAGVADRMVVMKGGRVVEEGPTDMLLSRAVHPYTRVLVAAVPRLDAGDQPRAPRQKKTKEARPLLTVENLTRHFTAGGPLRRRSVRALDGVSFELRAGESLALVGESGSGKSTLGRIVLGLLRPTAGSVRFFGRRMGAVFQDPTGSLNPRMCAAELIAEPLLAAGRSGAQVRERVEELLEMVGLGREYAGRLPHQLSGGQRQRVGIARALALDPCLVVADEPLSALDVSVQAQIVSLLGGLRERLGLSYLFITHDLALCPQLADRVAVMKGGRLVEIGPVRQVLTRPAHPYTQALLDALPRWGRAVMHRPGAV